MPNTQTIAQRLRSLYDNLVIANNTTNEFVEALPDCYDAVEAKGGTIPAQETAANLPAAIASIPSGGVVYDMTGITLKSTASDKMYDIVLGDSVEVYDDTNVNKVVIAYQQWAVVPNCEKLILPYVTYVDNYDYFCAYYNCKYFVANNMTLLRSISAFNYSALVEISLPNLEQVMSAYTFAHCSSLAEASFPKLYRISQAFLYNCAALERVEFGVITTWNTNSLTLGSCPNLIDIEFAQGVAINLSFDGWVPTNVLTDSAKIAQLNANIRDHIADKVSGAKTISFKAGIYGVLEQATKDAFTNKGWTVANLG